MKQLKSPLPLARGCAGLFGLVWTGITCLAGGSMVLVLFAGPTDGSASLDPIALAFPVLFIAGFLVIGIVMMAWGVLPLIARMKVEPPEVKISNDRLRVGEEFTVTYQQAFKKASEVKQASLQLVLRESASYSHGTDRSTVTHDHMKLERQLPVRRYEAGETMTARLSLTVPDDAMHSLAGHNNRLLWFIRIRVGLSGWPDSVEEFPITVLAERIG